MQLYLYILGPWSSLGTRAWTLKSVFQLSDMFCSQEYTSFTPILKEWHNRQKQTAYTAILPAIVYIAF
jgi:hypothetical protein